MVNVFDVKIKLLNDCCEPMYKTPGAAAADCLANINGPIKIEPGKMATIPLGFALEMPAGVKALIKPRSGLASKRIIACVGTIDNDYRGEVKTSIINLSDEDYEIVPYARIAQIEFEPYVQANFYHCEELTDTKRGQGGFGSTGV